MKKPKLTEKELEALNIIESTPGAFLRGYKNPSNVFMYRLMNDKHSPVRNIEKRYIMELYRKDRLTKKDGCFYPVPNLTKK